MNENAMIFMANLLTAIVKVFLKSIFEEYEFKIPLTLFLNHPHDNTPCYYKHDHAPKLFVLSYVGPRLLPSSAGLALNVGSIICLAFIVHHTPALTP
jgi:hypothetical protein